MLKKTIVAFMMTVAMFLSACEKDTDTYPVSGEQCGPEDPVKTLDAADCDVLPAGI
ncbi:hypothetical protein [Ruegeria arenilitoris]|uniref:hypothetical protein n=1 Tax=Ruegeria arenilitoris TaxID=1173585 RepID=UPI00147DBE9A|nr:hypothetical protein [Ruegeria arenilitoris]